MPIRATMLRKIPVDFFAIFIIFWFTKTVFTDQLMSPMKLMTNFGQFFIAKSIVLHTSTESVKLELLKVAKEINKEGQYFVIANIEGNCTVDLKNVDLHIAIIDNNQAFDYFNDCFDRRKKYNKEPWILYGNSTVPNTISSLEMASLDLDDVVILTTTKEEKTNLVEVYKIGPDNPIDFNDVGTWTENEGIEFTTKPKWYRRGNLKVGEPKIFSSYQYLYW
jgi:hypothetical protein